MDDVLPDDGQLVDVIPQIAVMEQLQRQLLVENQWPFIGLWIDGRDPRRSKLTDPEANIIAGHSGRVVRIVASEYRAQ